MDPLIIFALELIKLHARRPWHEFPLPRTHDLQYDETETFYVDREL